MAYVRKRYWIPKLRQLTKQIVKNYYGCKIFYVVPYSTQQAMKNRVKDKDPLEDWHRLCRSFQGHNGKEQIKKGLRLAC